MTRSLDTLSASQIRDGIVAGDFTATEVAHAALDAVQQRDGSVQAFLQVSPELALEAAARVDKARTLITRDYAAAYEKADVILMPACPRTAFKFGELSDPTQMYLSDLYTISINIVGNGGVSVPLGLGAESGLPTSAQLVGPAFRDRDLLTFARAVEKGAAAAADHADGSPALAVAPDFAGKGGELA